MSATTASTGATAAATAALEEKVSDTRGAASSSKAPMAAPVKAAWRWMRSAYTRISRTCRPGQVSVPGSLELFPESIVRSELFPTQFFCDI
eukprot:8782098-Pyramimonas_sp.AAC.1